MSTTPVSPDDERAPPLPERWKELEPLVDEVLDASPADRLRVIRRLSDGDLDRERLLRDFVSDCELDTPLLDTPAAAQFAGLVYADEDQHLPDVLGERYRIEREIGRGGMARVFLALDTKHQRNVAVKVIRPELAASLGRGRFLREIGIAARLRHPNIVPLFDSGDADGLLYFVMPYEDGPSLRVRMESGGGLPTGEYLSVLRDIARALSYAHEQGIVHRDVKPDNVMLSGGAAVVTDFGIAKAVSVAQGETGGGITITQAGMGIGTPAYMAPEQAVGDPDTDHRADIYSLGCVAYELISGRPPFHGMPTHQLVAAHVATAARPLSELRSDVPASIEALVMQCLAKDPVDRPQTAKDVLAQLESSSSSAQSAAPQTVVQRAAGTRRRRWTAIAAVVVLSIGALGYAAVRARAVRAVQDVTVSVLPMRSESTDPVQRALAEGLSDEIAIELFRVPGIRVKSKKGVANYRDQRELDTEKLGRELGSRFLVMGTLKEAGGRLRVLASLVRASDGAVLWTDGFDRAQDDLAGVRSDIARAVGDTLSRLVNRARPAVPLASARRREPNPEAYRLYILAQRALERRGLSIQSSVDNFAQSTASDSLFAEAWAGLSLSRALSPYFTPLLPSAVAPAVRAAALRALRLDSTLATPHVALGLVHQHAYQWDSAASEFRKALQLRDAGDVEPLIQYGRHLLFRGNVRAGLDTLLLARRSEPASALVSSWVSYAYYLDGQRDSALAESRRAFQSDTMNLTTLTHGALIRQSLGLSAEARRFADRSLPLNPSRVYVLSVQGDTSEVMNRIRAAEDQLPRPGLIGLARAYAMLGIRDTAGAMAALDRATTDGEMWPSIQSVIDPVYWPLWPSARFKALRERVGLGALQPPAGALRPRR
jgi:eukaryotic-like serine/threonine-protein kinase